MENSGEKWTKENHLFLDVFDALLKLYAPSRLPNIHKMQIKMSRRKAIAVTQRTTPFSYYHCWCYAWEFYEPSTTVYKNKEQGKHNSLLDNAVLIRARRQRLHHESIGIPCSL